MGGACRRLPARTAHLLVGLLRFSCPFPNCKPWGPAEKLEKTPCCAFGRFKSVQPLDALPPPVRCLSKRCTFHSGSSLLQSRSVSNRLVRSYSRLPKCVVLRLAALLCRAEGMTRPSVCLVSIWNFTLPVKEKNIYLPFHSDIYFTHLDIYHTSSKCNLSGRHYHGSLGKCLQGTKEKRDSVVIRGFLGILAYCRNA